MNRHLLPAPDESESGMAMITAIMVTMVVLFLGMTSVSLSDHSFSAQRIDRKRVATFHAAEAGIDHALQILQSTPQVSLPCTPLTASLGTGAGSGDYSVTFQFFDAAGAALTCPLASVPRSVLLTSTGDSNEPLGSPRQIQVTANLGAPVSASAFDKTVFADSSVNFNNSSRIEGFNGNDAIIYTNGSYACSNSHQAHGFVYAQGTGTLGNSCLVRGDIWVKGALTMTGSATVNRDAISGTSSITMSSPQSLVRRNARAATTITTNNAGNILGLRIPTSPAGDPPTATFPEVPYTQVAWTNAGYTVRAYTDCALAATELRTLASTWTSPTLMRITGCPLAITNNSTITLANHLAIVSDQGITMSNQSTWSSSSTALRELHLIVPFGSSCTGSLGDITMSNNFEVRSPVRTLAYTPCDLSLANSGQLQGQFYGKNLSIANNTTLKYAPVSGIPGYTASTTSTLVRQVTILYKREV